jgi:predicted nucleic-acid-binding protein
MIGIDTNILVRYYAQDDPAQSRMATEFLEEGLEVEAGYISLVVIAELVWVLTSVYKLDKMRLIDVLGNLLAAEELHIEQTEVFVSALRRFEESAGQFTDLLIASAARHGGCSETYTFDEGAARKAGMTLLRDSS